MIEYENLMWCNSLIINNPTEFCGHRRKHRQQDQTRQRDLGRQHPNRECRSGLIRFVVLAQDGLSHEYRRSETAKLRKH